MTSKIFISIAMMVASALSAAATEPQAVAKEAPQWMDPDNLTLAAVSKTNAFEIVPAAGMELLQRGTDAPHPADGDASSLQPSTFAEELASFQDETAQMVADMLGFAKTFMGTRYRRGGKSPKGFDCSGFTSYVFDQFGIKLNNNSGSQFTQGSKVERGEIEPGDLVFFKGSASRSSRVGHVGIAVSSDPETGEVTFIHAATSKGISIDRLSAPYYKARYLGARRVIAE